MGDCRFSEERLRKIVRDELARHHMELERIVAQKDFDERMGKLLGDLAAEERERTGEINETGA